MQTVNYLTWSLTTGWQWTTTELYHRGYTHRLPEVFLLTERAERGTNLFLKAKVWVKVRLTLTLTQLFQGFRFWGLTLCSSPGVQTQ